MSLKPSLAGFSDGSWKQHELALKTRKQVGPVGLVVVEARLDYVAWELSQLQDAGAYTLELCEGRGLLTLKGAAWRWTLMKGGSLDFEALAPGQVAQTSLFKISTLIWVVAVDEVHLLVPLSFARALSERLLDAGVDQVSKTLQLFD